MKKRAQANIFVIIVWLIIILLVLGSGLGFFVNTMSGVALDSGLTGIEAFFISNLILWFIVGIIIAVLWWGAR
jgi:hypothetical protein